MFQRIHFKELNLIKIVSDYLAARGEYLSPLWEASLTTEGEEDSWCRRDPPYTLYGTVTHSFVKYLTNRCLQRHSLLSEFFKGRPEFFLVVSGRTVIHLTADAERKMTFRPQNALFQLMFDYEVVLTLPRASFFPWKKSPTRSSPSSARFQSSLQRLYSEHDDSFYLLRVRPKMDLGLHPDTCPEHLDFLVHSIYRNKDVR